MTEPLVRWEADAVARVAPSHRAAEDRVDVMEQRLTRPIRNAAKKADVGGLDAV